ncbi:unnamed protein product [Penicillium salamii]|uniref:Checkpoint protein RAD24-like helical bundle domain-containing protein n=1 Tax=Penicillium salamii TaxID=1612424 RepID=A0A9W4JDX2_9EURO|nr:unnamed protein product [Penicillium salamii]
MDPPPKRQRRSEKSRRKPVPQDSSSPIESTSPFALSNRPRPASPKASPEKAKSLHNFFQPATEAQRWAAIEKPTEDVDLIEDDYDSYDEIFTQHLANERAVSSSATQTRDKPKPKPLKPKPKAPPKKPTKKFILPTRTKVDEPILEDGRPWAQRYAPDSLAAIAVHKKKVSDVQSWLEDSFAGRRSERLLVLRGPAGSGKTTTISLLSDSLGYDIIEWKNPPVSEFGSNTYQSASAQFEEFLGRGDRFGGLDLDSDATKDKRILLIEEFPSMLGRGAAHTAFRVSLQRYLAASGGDHPPVVIIVSETLLGSASSVFDNLTVHRLLGPTVYNHPGTTILDFNAIAPTFMHKALRTILEREARDSKRVHIPGPAVLDRISEIGDIRSAISSLEFLCLKGDDTGAWGGSLTKKKTRAEVALTATEKETLKLVTQREASLGMFHAVGKIVYNKRMDPSLVEGEDIEVLPAPPAYLSHFHRPKASQVLVNDLVDETGTDISTFISALHENYLPSCHGDDFTDTFGDCIEALSDSEILSTDRRSRGARTGVGIGINTFSSGVDALRQEEMSFQVATRGLLFALPYPVQRKVGSGARRGGEAHQMLYPASLRLWRETEEIEGLVDSWSHRLLDPSRTSQSSEATGVSSWKSVQVGRSDDNHGVVTMMPRDDLLLHQLPYMALIRRQDPDWWQLNKIVGNRRDAEVTPPALPPTEEKLYLSDDDIMLISGLSPSPVICLSYRLSSRRVLLHTLLSVQFRMINDNDSSLRGRHRSQVSPLSSDESITSHPKEGKVDETKRDASSLVSATALAVIPNWTSMVLMVSLIFGGCCANVFALEAIIKEQPTAGPLITFAQFIVCAVFTLPHFLSPAAGPTALFLSPRAIPLKSWTIYTLYFLSVNLLNNWAFAYKISVPLHIILRSAGPVASMIIGYLYNGHRYSRGQIASVGMLTLGVAAAAMADAKTKGPVHVETDLITTVTGFTILALAMILSAFQGIFADRLYATYGRDHWKEALFYSHALSLPVFFTSWGQLAEQWRVVAGSPSLVALDGVQGLLRLVPNKAVWDLVGMIPVQVAYLAMNALTQYLCIRGVHLLSAKSSSLTVTIVLNVRKLASLLLSIYLFGNHLAGGVLVGAALVFVGGGLYGFEGARLRSVAKKSQ